ncbi:MAG: hypothetical protein JWO10_593 [Microbacteriaceae bacterium]|nr:hypothetical protein [Microbacteriaceae bacterium]
MTDTSRRSRIVAAARAELRRPILHPRTHGRFAIGAFAAVAVLTALAVLIPPPSSEAEALKSYIKAHAQSFIASRHIAAALPLRDSYDASPGIPTLMASGTNHDWARLVMLYAGWPMTEANVTVMTRWMRQENGAASWWNRNNPLNTGAGGFGTYPDLRTAAESVAKTLKTSPGYAGIAAGFASGASTEATEQAIWASPWATGHYANGGHWHYTPVDEVKAPGDAW